MRKTDEIGHNFVIELGTLCPEKENLQTDLDERGQDMDIPKNVIIRKDVDTVGTFVVARYLFTGLFLQQLY